MKSREMRMDKGHDLRHILRVFWNSDHLGPVRMNGSTNCLVSFQRSGRWSIVNKAPEQLLDKEDIIRVLLRLKKSVNQCIVLVNIL